MKTNTLSQTANLFRFAPALTLATSRSLLVRRSQYGETAKVLSGKTEWKTAANSP